MPPRSTRRPPRSCLLPAACCLRFVARQVGRVGEPSRTLPVSMRPPPQRAASSAACGLLHGVRPLRSVRPPPQRAASSAACGLLHRPASAEHSPTPEPRPTSASQRYAAHPDELVALGAPPSGIVQMTLPLLLRVGLGAQPPAVQGMAVGAAAHVGGMAALRRWATRPRPTPRRSRSSFSASLRRFRSAGGEHAAIACVRCRRARGRGQRTRGWRAV